MTELTTCFECEARVPVNQFEGHACPAKDDYWENDPYGFLGDADDFDEEDRA